MPELITLGHGRLDRAGLLAQLRAAGAGHLVDVRRFPGSRANPDVGRDALADWLPGSGLTYRWEERLGGRRRLPAGETSLDPWWTVEAFRAYAAHTRSPDFVHALAELGEGLTARDGPGGARAGATVVMCSESVWWRCHRRLVADVAVLGHRWEVRHLMPGGRLVEHRVAPGARRRPDGLLVWDGEEGPGA